MSVLLSFGVSVQRAELLGRRIEARQIRRDRAAGERLADRWVSIRSTSWNVIVPDAVGVPSSVTPPDAAAIVARDGRRVLGAGDRHRDVLGDRAAMMVVDGDGVGLGDGLADRQLLRRSLSSVKVQPTVAMIVGVAVALVQRQRQRAELAGSPGRSPAAAVEAERRSAPGRWWVSIRSTSWNVIVPGRGLLAVLDHAARLEAAVVAAVMVGASLVPVIVTVTSWVTVPPCWSSMLTV